MSDDQQFEIARWYTRARRFPQLIGRTPDGTKLPGGPYTFLQIIGGGVFVWAALKTAAWWGPFGVAGNALLLAGATWALIVLLGRVPPGARNPVTLLSGLLQAFTAAPAGRVAGRIVRIRRPHRYRTVLVLHHQRQTFLTVTPTVEAPPSTTVLAPAPAPAPATPLQLTGVQRLLAATAYPHQET